MINSSGKRHYVLFALVAVTGLAADLATKSYAFHVLDHPTVNQGRVAWVIEGFFGFQTSLNEGALFGMGQGYRWIFVSLAGLAVLGIAGWFAVGQPGKDKMLTVVLAMLLAGILGNMYDRMGLPAWEGPWTWKADVVNPSSGDEHAEGDPIYAVRDFIVFRFGTYQWPNFNIADSLLVCGVGLLLFHAYVLEPRQRQRAAGETAEATEAGSAKIAEGA